MGEDERDAEEEWYEREEDREDEREGGEEWEEWGAGIDQSIVEGREEGVGLGGEEGRKRERERKEVEVGGAKWVGPRGEEKVV